MKRLLMALFLLLCFALSAQAAEEKFKDYIFRGMPNFELSEQVRNFEELTIKSAKPESEEVEETTHEGSRVHSQYSYIGKEDDVPSSLQIVRNYQEAVKALGRKTLYFDKRNFQGKKCLIM